MSVGDISFIAAFIVLPLIIVALSVMALKTLNRRERSPLARFSSNDPVQTTQEFPIASLEESRNWATTVRPTRGPAKHDEARSAAATLSFKMPTYRGRASGVVRRIGVQPRGVPRTARSEPVVGSEDPEV